MELKNKDGLIEKEFLDRYDASKYDRPSVTVDMLIFTVIDNKLKLLMVKRGDHPFIGKWALPGGFVNIDEDLDIAAQRELKEETSLDNIYMEQIHTWGDVGRDPRTRIITTAYMALVDSKDLKVKADDDAADADWFSVEYEIDTKENDLVYKINLKGDKAEVSGTVLVKKICNERTSKIVRQIVESNSIAGDHIKIIEHALEVLKKKIKDNEVPSEFMKVTIK